MQCAKLATINTTTNTAISMQENPAYAYGMINEAKPKPEDTDDYIWYNESEKQDKQLDTQLLLCAKIFTLYFIIICVFSNIWIM